MNIHMKGHLQEHLQGPTWDAREKQWPFTPLKANIFFLDFELAFLEMGILCFHKKMSFTLEGLISSRFLLHRI